MSNTNKELNNVQLNVTFVPASIRENIVSGENISTSFGKLSKLFSDLKSIAWDGHPTVTQNDTTSSVSPNPEETFTVVDSVSRNSEGHITGINTKTVKLPTGSGYVHPTYDSYSSGLYKITVDTTGHVSATSSVTKSDIPSLDYISSTTTRNVNLILAGPSSGSAAAPTFRALVTADLPASGATAGSYGPSANTSPAHGGTFSVPYITINAQGQVTSASTKTITLPTSSGSYLPLSGGTLTGKLTVNSDIVIPNDKAVADNTVPVAGSLATITDNDFTQLANYKSIIGSIKNNTDGVWNDVISVRHRNGYNDGSDYGIYIRSVLNASGNLIWNKQTSSSTWQGERTILDSGNYTNIITPSSIGASESDHTHKYAAASSAGGAAHFARKLVSKDNNDMPITVGSRTNPVWIAEGKPSQCQYTLEKSVPADAVFTDTKNTAGTSDTTAQLYIVGAPSQAESFKTYSNSKCYIANNCLYSNGTAVSVAGHTHSEYASSSHRHSEYASASHTHSEYASSSHTHPYLPLTGGTVNGSITANKYNGHKVAGTSGSWWASIPVVSNVGVMEIGKYIDFHISNTGKTDYDVRLTGGSGNLACSGSFSSAGADYAEFWEMEDGNPNNEDLRGFFVTVNENNKISKANENDFILGVISSNPVVIGNDYQDIWRGKYLKDVYGNRITVEKEVDGVKTFEYVINPDYDPDIEYVSRADRKEWQVVGLTGQLIANDDGTSKPGSFCKVKDGGIATSSASGYRVLERIDDSHIKILFR